MSDSYWRFNNNKAVLVTQACLAQPASASIPVTSNNTTKKGSASVEQDCIYTLPLENGNNEAELRFIKVGNAFSLKDQPAVSIDEANIRRIVDSVKIADNLLLGDELLKDPRYVSLRVKTAFLLANFIVNHQSANIKEARELIVDLLFKLTNSKTFPSNQRQFNGALAVSRTFPELNEAQRANSDFIVSLLQYVLPAEVAINNFAAKEDQIWLFSMSKYLDANQNILDKIKFANYQIELDQKVESKQINADDRDAAVRKLAAISDFDQLYRFGLNFLADRFLGLEFLYNEDFFAAGKKYVSWVGATNGTSSTESVYFKHAAHQSTYSYAAVSFCNGLRELNKGLPVKNNLATKSLDNCEYAIDVHEQNPKGDLSLEVFHHINNYFYSDEIKAKIAKQEDQHKLLGVTTFPNDQLYSDNEGDDSDRIGLALKDLSKAAVKRGANEIFFSSDALIKLSKDSISDAPLRVKRHYRVAWRIILSELPLLANSSAAKMKLLVDGKVAELNFVVENNTALTHYLEQLKFEANKSEVRSESTLPWLELGAAVVGSGVAAAGFMLDSKPSKYVGSATFGLGVGGYIGHETDELFLSDDYGAYSHGIGGIIGALIGAGAMFVLGGDLTGHNPGHDQDLSARNYGRDFGP